MEIHPQLKRQMNQPTKYNPRLVIQYLQMILNAFLKKINV